jgi:alpha-beta hydrolase superfamily lysophospholipase
VVTGQRGAGILKLAPAEGRLDRTVVVLHGLGSVKERTLTYLYHLAAAGFDAVAIDLFLHGDRPEAPCLQQLIDTDLASAVRSIIYESAADVPAICSEIGVNITKSGIVGISAGGFVAHALAIMRPQFKAMTAAISSPEWLTIDPEHTPDPSSAAGRELAEISPVNHPDLYAPMPVCLLSAGCDEVVDNRGTLKLADRLDPIYRRLGFDSRLRSVVYPETGHQFSDAMLRDTIDWMRMHL